MNNLSLLNHLIEMTKIGSLSGNEDAMSNYIRSVLAGKGIKTATDNIGNLYAKFKGTTDKSLLITAHMDEVGFLISKPKDERWMCLPIGHAKLKRDGAKVAIHTETGVASGLIKEFKDRSYLIELDQQSAGKNAVGPGCPVTFLSEPIVKEVRVQAKSLDDRVGCAVLVELAACLRESPPSFTSHLVWTVREEYGYTGVMAVAAKLHPDLGIALDVTPIGTEPSEAEHLASFGNGAVLTVLDGGLLGYPAVTKRLQRLAQEKNIPLQLEIVEAGVSEAARLQWVGGGRPVAAICIPVLDNGTDAEIIDANDLTAMFDLVHAFAISPP